MRTEHSHGLSDDGGLLIDESLIGADRFVFWRGASGKRYLCTIYDVDHVPDYAEVVALFVRRCLGGSRMAVHVEQVEAPFTADRLSLLGKARELGLDEVHLHFLAGTPPERRRVLFDLKARLDCKPAVHASIRVA